MAAVNYTPISLYYSSTATNTPSAGNLVLGELAINIADGKLYYKNPSNVVTLLAVSGGAITPITNNGVVYINGSGQAVSGSALTFDGTNVQIGATGALRFADTDSSNYVAFKSPGVVSANVTWTLPSADGTSGQALSTNGSGTLSWASISASAATPTALGTVYGDSDSASPFTAALGYQAAASTTGVNVTALGYQAGFTNTSGTSNTFVGYQAGYLATGSFSTSVGFQAGYSNTDTGGLTTFVGYQAGKANTTGYGVVVGGNALLNNTTGSAYVSVGNNALRSNTTGSSNTAVGEASLYSNTTASANTAVGLQALYSNTTGTSNTALGYQTLYSNVTGAESTAIGYNAYRLGTASYNLAIGAFAMSTGVVTGTQNTAVGRNVLGALTSGSFNVGYGDDVLRSNTTGSSNVAIGVSALQSTTTSTNNTSVGHESSFSNTTGVVTAFGYRALYSNTTASFNTAVGYETLTSNTTATFNTAVGYQSGNLVTTGIQNSLFGFGSGSNITTGRLNTCIGNAGPSSATGEWQIIIGNLSGFQTLGKGDSTGFINPNGGGVYQGNNAATWSVTSDQRLKKNIVDNTDGLSVINGIRIRNFEYRLPEEVDAELKPTDAIKKPGVQLGVIAQELQQVLPDCVKQESTGVLSVDSDNLTWYLINAVKELSAKVASLESQLNGVQP